MISGDKFCEYLLDYSLFIVYIAVMQKIDTREQILEAAKARFGYYGFNKTTMAEIAKDCDMSAANIYRHFDGKNDIIAVLAKRIFNSQETKLAAVVSQDSPSYSEKLRNFFLEALLSTHQYATEQPKIKEMVDFIGHERLDLIQANGKKIENLIETILREGVESGEFDIDDITNTAQAFKKATVMFHTPLFMNMHSLDELKLFCRNILNLLIAAIISKNQD